MGALVYFPDRFDLMKRQVHKLERRVTVRRLVRKSRHLRAATYRDAHGRHEFCRPTAIALNDRWLLRKEWKRATVGPDDIVIVWTLPPRPQGMGGAGGGSNPLPIILAVAVAAVATTFGGPLGTAMGFAAGSALGAAIGGAVISLAGAAISYGIMSLFSSPPPSVTNQQSGYGGGAPQASPTYNLQAQGNSARLGQPIPEAFGKNRMFPDFIGQPYVFYANDEQFIYHALGLGMGEYSIDTAEIRIGDTPIASFEEIVWQQVEPNAVGNTSIADLRMMVCPDIADIELLRVEGQDEDDELGWAGPFIANPPGTVVEYVFVDVVCPRGLYKFNSSGGFDSMGVEVSVQGQPIDDAGEPTGDWVYLGDTIELNGATQTPRRHTYTYPVSPGRWQVRLRREDEKDESASAAHEVHWVGLKGLLTTYRRFPDMTHVLVRMKATGDLNSVTSRRFNLVATRKLPTWTGSAMGTALAATRSPLDAFAHICRTQNGGRLADGSIDLAGLYAHADALDELGYTFDFVFDQSTTTSEALAKIARSVIGERVVQGNQIRLVRDVPVTAPVMMFGPRNIRQGSLELDYKMVDRESSDGITGTWMNPAIGWKPDEITVAWPESRQERLTSMTLDGVTSRAQARAMLWHMLRADRYRRRTVRWRTEMEGLMCLFGDGISFSHDVPQWGQSAEVLDWDGATRTLTLSDELAFTSGATHYIALRDAMGFLAGPYVATAVEDHADQVVVGAGTLPDIVTGGDAERTFVQFGPGESYARRLKVIQVTPQGEDTAEIVAIDDDPRLYDELPDDGGDGTPDPGGSQEALDLHVASNWQHGNLRTLANDYGYSGLASQPVTITIDAGVEVYSITAGVPGLARGTWPAGFQPKLVNLGIISGVGGAGGNGGDGVASPGGDAIDSRSGSLLIDNGGTIRGGGGGGGGGGNHNSPSIGGGGGGGGAGYNQAPGGEPYAGIDGTGQAGSYGSADGPGAGGAGATVEDASSGDGGAGGDWGQPGVGGQSSDTSGLEPGAAGYAVRGNDQVQWLGTGTRLGTIG